MVEQGMAIGSSSVRNAWRARCRRVLTAAGETPRSGAGRVFDEGAQGGDVVRGWRRQSGRGNIHGTTWWVVSGRVVIVSSNYA